MLPLTHKSIALAFAAAVCLYGADAAEAGFMSISLGDDTQSLLSTEAAGAVSAPSKDRPERPADPSFEDTLFAFGVAIPAETSSSSMGGGPSSGPSGAAQSMLVADDASSPGQIVTYLTGEPGLSLPIPFLDGVFRPPRA